jgi:hypothetical protein
MPGELKTGVGSSDHGEIFNLAIDKLLIICNFVT